jgi:iron complex outermembrane receptor protein
MGVIAKASAVAMVAALFSVAAVAQESRSSALEEIVVTAERRAQSLQDIPLSITAFSQDDMDLRNATDLRALQNFTPNLEFNNESGGQNNSRITIRGVGTETLVGGGDPGVALHVDGVYVGRNSAAAQSVFDVERLEVLRGPQGTLYGRNAVGGSINIITKNPTDDFMASADATLGNYARARIRGILNVPFGDNVAARFSVQKEERDGYLENLYPGGRDNDDVDSLGFRGKLRWTLNDAEVILGAFYNRFEGAGRGSGYLGADTDYQFGRSMVGISDGSSGPPPGAPIVAPAKGDALPMSTDIREIRKDSPEFIDQTMKGIDLTVTWAFSDSVELKSITAFQQNDNSTLVDADNTEIRVEERARENDAEQWSQELNLVSTGDTALDWILGAFIYHEELTEDFFTIGYPGNVDPNVPLPGGQQPGGNGVSQNPLANHKTDSFAVFGQATYHVTDSLRLTAGLRYTKDEKEQTRSGGGIVDLVNNFRFNGGGAQGVEPEEFVSDDWTNTSGKLSVDYDVNDSSMLYASYSQGFKSGGIPFNGVMIPYEPEEVDAYEIGSKNQFLDDRLRLNLVAFYYDYTDLQVFRLTGEGPRADNAAQSTVKGLEAEFQAILSDSFSIDGSFGTLDATYDEYTIPIPPSDFSGNTLNHAPEYTANLGAQYIAPIGSGELTVRADYSGRGDTYFDRANGPFDLQEAYGIFSLNVRYDATNWYVALYGRNLGDEDYVTGQLINPPFNCGCRTVSVGEPRTYGIIFGMEWD